MLWAEHDSFWPFWHLLVPGKQLDGQSQLILCPDQSCLSCLGMLWAKHDSFFIFAILALVGAWSAAGGTLSSQLILYPDIISHV
jgi:hypothetical protein